MEHNKLCNLFREVKDDLKQLEDYVFELREEKESDTLRNISDYDLIAEIVDRGYDVTKHKEAEHED